MTRKTFFSFYYKEDNRRAPQVRNMGAIEGNSPVSDNDWETVTKGGDKAIEKWIDEQMSRRSCVMVLVGSNTAGRKWIKHEIQKAWDDKKGLLGIYIHGLQDKNERVSTKGSNPFTAFTVGKDKKPLETIVKRHDPGCTTSKGTYNHIRDKLAEWVEEAIKVRADY